MPLRIALGSDLGIRQDIRVEESVTRHNFAVLDRNRLIEHGSGVGESVKLAILGARIDPGGHAADQVMVEIAADEIAGQLRRIDSRRCGRAGRRPAFLKSVRACCVPRGETWGRVRCRAGGLRGSGERLRERDRRKRWPKFLSQRPRRRRPTSLVHRHRCCRARARELPRAAGGRRSACAFSSA